MTLEERVRRLMDEGGTVGDVLRKRLPNYSDDELVERWEEGKSKLKRNFKYKTRYEKADTNIVQRGHGKGDTGWN
ncbi:MAG: hypothetical protein KF744_09145 [Taibaiella sp.]|nr:hypothetical protein [Taibaiella sp.]